MRRGRRVMAEELSTFPCWTSRQQGSTGAGEGVDCWDEQMKGNAHDGMNEWAPCGNFLGLWLLWTINAVNNFELTPRRYCKSFYSSIGEAAPLRRVTVVSVTKNSGRQLTMKRLTMASLSQPRRTRLILSVHVPSLRSEERRVGKECA